MVRFISYPSWPASGGPPRQVRAGRKRTSPQAQLGGPAKPGHDGGEEGALRCTTSRYDGREERAEMSLQLRSKLRTPSPPTLRHGPLQAGHPDRVERGANAISPPACLGGPAKPGHDGGGSEIPQPSWYASPTSVMARLGRATQAGRKWHIWHQPRTDEPAAAPHQGPTSLSSEGRELWAR